MNQFRWDVRKPHLVSLNLYVLKEIVDAVVILCFFKLKQNGEISVNQLYVNGLYSTVYWFSLEVFGLTICVLQVGANEIATKQDEKSPMFNRLLGTI